MTFAPNPKLSLLLWRMLTGETVAEREPMLSKARPKVSGKECAPLVEQGFLTMEKRGRPIHLLLTERAWAWASESVDVTFSKSPEGTMALQGLLRRLIPFLKEHDLALASLFMDSEKEKDATAPLEPEPRAKAQSSTAIAVSEASAIRKLIQTTCLELSGGQRRQRVSLTALRLRLPQVPRALLDEQLIGLQRDQKLVLYREDNGAALTEADHQAALIVGESPRHLVILEN